MESFESSSQADAMQPVFGSGGSPKNDILQNEQDGLADCLSTGQLKTAKINVQSFLPDQNLDYQKKTSFISEKQFDTSQNIDSFSLHTTGSSSISHATNQSFITPPDSAKLELLPEDTETDVVCSVCMIGECEDQNNIVFCDGCNCAVHQYCYGISVVPDGSWYCCLCQWKHKKERASARASTASSSGTPQETINYLALNIRCRLCNHSGGAMRRGPEKIWVHSACVLYCTSGPQFKKRYTLSEPYSLRSSLNHAKIMGWRCSVCKFGGYPIVCAYPKCQTRLHVTCARERGYPCFIQSLSGTENVGTPVTVWKAIFCAQHADPSHVDRARQSECRRVSLSMHAGRPATHMDSTNRSSYPANYKTSHQLCNSMQNQRPSIQSPTVNTSNRSENKSKKGRYSQNLSKWRQRWEYEGAEVSSTTQSQSHFASLRGIRVNWSRFEAFFKQIHLHDSSIFTHNENVEQTSEEQYIEQVIRKKTELPSPEALSKTSESVLKELDKLYGLFGNMISESPQLDYPKTERDSVTNSTTYRAPLTALVDFGPVAAWTCFEVVNADFPSDAANTKEKCESVTQPNNLGEFIETYVEPIIDREVSASAPSLSTKNSDESVTEKSNVLQSKNNEQLEKRLRVKSFKPLSYYQLMYCRNKLDRILLSKNGSKFDVQPYVTIYSDGIFKDSKSTCIKKEDCRDIQNELAENQESCQLQSYSEANPVLHKEVAYRHANREDAISRDLASDSIYHDSYAVPEVEILGGHKWIIHPEEEPDSHLEHLIADSDDFVGRQTAYFLDTMAVFVEDLKRIRENLLANILEENRHVRVVDPNSEAGRELLNRSGAMHRWNHLRNCMIYGYQDHVHVTRTNRRAQKTEETAVAKVGMPPISPIIDSKDSATGSSKWEEEVIPSHCAVCFSEERGNLNPVFTCVRCQMPVHRNCYGVGRPGDETESVEWICRRCDAEKASLGSQWLSNFQAESIRCIICCHGGGALKRCVTGGWVHMFCVLWLMPESECLNWASLDVWSLDNVAMWRRQAICSICNIQNGICIKCSHPDCTTMFHPMCSWIHGLFAKATPLQSFKTIHGQLDSCFPDIQLDFFCFTHTPAAHKNRNCAEQMNIRRKRYVNRDFCSDIFRGHKKDKSSSMRPSSRVATRHSTEAPNVIIEPSPICFIQPDIYHPNVCAVCLKLEPEDTRHLLCRCQKCGIYVHFQCYGVPQKAKTEDNESFRPNADEVETFVCDVCLWSPNPHDHHCQLCPRRGGALKLGIPSNLQKPSSKAYFSPFFAHVTCCLWTPGVEIADNPRLSPVKGIDVVRKMQYECVECRMSYGFSLKCSQRGCYKYYHPLCAQLKGYFMEQSEDFFQRQKNITFCDEHSALRNRVSPSVRLFLRLRSFLELAKIIVEQLQKKEMLKRSWLQKRKQSLEVEYHLTSPPCQMGCSSDPALNTATDRLLLPSSKRQRRSEDDVLMPLAYFESSDIASEGNNINTSELVACNSSPVKFFDTLSQELQTYNSYSNVCSTDHNTDSFSMESPHLLSPHFHPCENVPPQFSHCKTSRFDKDCEGPQSQFDLNTLYSQQTMHPKSSSCASAQVIHSDQNCFISDVSKFLYRADVTRCDLPNSGSGPDEGMESMTTILARTSNDLSCFNPSLHQDSSKTCIIEHETRHPTLVSRYIPMNSPCDSIVETKSES